MAEKPKAVRAKAKETQEEQSARFIKTARELDVDETGTRFDEALKKLVPHKSRRRVI